MKTFDELSKEEKEEFISDNDYTLEELVDVADQPRTRSAYKKAFARHLYHIINNQ